MNCKKNNPAPACGESFDLTLKNDYSSLCDHSQGVFKKKTKSILKKPK